MSDPVPPIHRPLDGLRGLVLGVANEHSIAWGCARVLAERGARVALTCLNEKAVPYVAPLAERIGAPLLRCNVEEPGELQAAVNAAAAQLGGLDFGVHSIAWAPKDDLHGRVVDSTAEGFNQAVRVSCHSFAEMARLMEPHLSNGGALVTMSYIGADEAVPHYGLMGPLKATLESLGRCVALLVGPENSGMTGQTLYVDAGDHAVR